ncbi:MAG: tetratricopeptide repeat protein, partial [Chitinivibrionales bacterium]|nr:tetratricopeptide repeat protein [Chitinivibrionales bacterium]
MKAAILSVAGEEEWLRLKRYLEFSDGFALYFIFTAHPAIIETFRDRLATIYRARITKLHEPAIDRPEQLSTEVLPRLLSPRIHKKAVAAPCWLDLSGHLEPEWAEARLNFLSRLNEQREPLRKALNLPLVLILPEQEREKIRTLVPDLWAIRDMTLTTGNWFTESISPISFDETYAQMKIPVLDLQPDEESIVEEWHRLQKMDDHEQDKLQAGWRAFDVFSQIQQWTDAEDVAQKCLEISRRILERVGETPETLRDLSVSLDNVGRAASSQGDYAESKRLYSES